MKSVFLLLFSILVFGSAYAQSELILERDGDKTYVQHTVATKEGLYAIARQYGVAPKDLAVYNGIDAANGLNVGQKLRIPLSTNFQQSAAAAGIPVYYVVGEKEGLFRVSTNNGKVLMADLRKWNNLSSDALSPGQKLIVGFISNSGVAAPNVAVVPSKVDNTPAPVVKTKRVTPPNKTPEAQLPTRDPAPASTREPTAPIRTAVQDGNGGYFKSFYDQQRKTGVAEKTVTAGIFKTTSGWNDSKYYALMDSVDPGTIVQVINPSNNKAVYAKVLGGMSGVSQNRGYDVRVSNAAASVLEIGETNKFIVKMAW